jgi:hypothetical protein
LTIIVTKNGLAVLARPRCLLTCLRAASSSFLQSYRHSHHMYCNPCTFLQSAFTMSMPITLHLFGCLP